MLQRWLEIVLNMTVAALAVVFVSLATQLRTTNVGFTGVGLVSLMSFGQMLGAIVRCYTHLETATGALSRLQKFAESKLVTSSNMTSESRAEVTPPKFWPEKGEVELNSASAVYRYVI